MENKNIIMDIQALIEGFRIFADYDSDPRIVTFDSEIRVTLYTGTHVGEDDTAVLKEFGWEESEGDWVRWL